MFLFVIVGIVVVAARVVVAVAVLEVDPHVPAVKEEAIRAAPMARRLVRRLDVAALLSDCRHVLAAAAVCPPPRHVRAVARRGSRSGWRRCRPALRVELQRGEARGVVVFIPALRDVCCSTVCVRRRRERPLLYSQSPQ